MKEKLQSLLDTSPFLRPWGFRVVDVKDDECTLELPHKPELERPAAGGAVAGRAAA